MVEYNLENVSKLCKQYPLIKLKYIFAIDRAQYILDKVKHGESRYVCIIPSNLERCNEDLKFLRLQRGRDDYDELNNGPVLNSIEQKLQEMIEKMELLAKQSGIQVKSNLEDIMLTKVQLAEAMGKILSDFANCSTLPQKNIDN